MTGWLLLLVFVALLVVLPVTVYNQLVERKNRFQNAFAQIEVQLKRRHDLIPNLVEAARAYLQYENETLVSVTQVRNAAVSALAAAHHYPDAAALTALADREQELMSALQGLNVQLEAYPDLRAADNMKQLSEEITVTENRIGFARQAYNDAAADYNTTRQRFPHVLLADFLGHREDAALLTFADSAALQSAPKASFS